MTASSNERKDIRKHLPYTLFGKLYLNSRISIKNLERELGISHHTLSKYLKSYEKQYGLQYTLDINTTLLGFSEARILAIKFGQLPPIKLLRKVLSNDPFVQNAYLATGDFDLILHVIGLNHTEYNHWEFKFRVGFSHYKIRVKTSTLDDIVEGVIPIRSKLISNSREINQIEKNILKELLKNSRIKLKNLAERTEVSQMKALYVIRKLQKKGIIKQFTTTIQDPDKRIFLFYTVNSIPNENHHSDSFLKFVERIINDEQNDITTDYSVVCDTSGNFDSIYFCNFKDGMNLNKRGPNFLKDSWASEYPIIEQCILIELLVGKWPFNANRYIKWRIEMEEVENNPIRFEIYR